MKQNEKIMLQYDSCEYAAQRHVSANVMLGVRVNARARFAIETDDDDDEVFASVAESEAATSMPSTRDPLCNLHRQACIEAADAAISRIGVLLLIVHGNADHTVWSPDLVLLCDRRRRVRSRSFLRVARTRSVCPSFDMNLTDSSSVGISP